MIKSICECQKQFMQDQIHEIEKYKWIVSEQIGYDLGQIAVREWIRVYAKDFRAKWFTENQNL
jgi:hypothetical protein